LYRNSPIGIAMFDAILELLESHKITPQQALIVVTQFDYSIRKIMASKYSEQKAFSFDAHVRWYRLYPDWCVMLLEDVAFYQHFTPRRIQLYKNQKNETSSNVSNKEYKTFLKKAKTNDVKVLIQQVPRLLLISKSSSITISALGTCNDPKFGKCKLVEEQRQFVHPRLSVYLLQGQENQNTARSEDQENKIDENVLPVPMLNRFKNSSMFSDIPRPQLEVEQYYGRKITLDPSYKRRFTYVHSFGNRKIHASSSKVGRISHDDNERKTEHLSHKVDELQKDLKSKDEEIAMLKARLGDEKK